MFESNDIGNFKFNNNKHLCIKLIKMYDTGNYIKGDKILFH